MMDEKCPRDLDSLGFTHLSIEDHLKLMGFQVTINYTEQKQVKCFK